MGDLNGEFCMEPEVTLLPERLGAPFARGTEPTRGMLARGVVAREAGEWWGRRLRASRVNSNQESCCPRNASYRRCLVTARARASHWTTAARQAVADTDAKARVQFPVPGVWLGLAGAWTPVPPGGSNVTVSHHATDGAQAKSGKWRAIPTQWVCGRMVWLPEPLTATNLWTSYKSQRVCLYVTCRGPPQHAQNRQEVTCQAPRLINHHVSRRRRSHNLFLSRLDPQDAALSLATPDRSLTMWLAHLSHSTWLHSRLGGRLSARAPST